MTRLSTTKRAHLIATIEDSAVIVKILTHLGLPLPIQCQLKDLFTFSGRKQKG